MERLTENYLGCNQIKGCSNGTCEEICKEVLDCGVCPISKAINKLADYEQAEEGGLLIRLPCKEGIEVFLSDYLDYHFKLKEYRFCGSKVVMVIECFELNNTCKRMLNVFDKTVFLTKAEAEQALAKMKGV